MGRASLIQNTFNAGELSPLMLGRQDVAKYQNGMLVCFNGLPFAQGGWTRRPATLFLHQTKDSGAAKSRLIPFTYSLTQAYMLEFGEEYIRFFANHGILVAAAKSIEDISQDNPGEITVTGHGYSNGTRLHISGVGGMTQLNGREVVVANAATDTFDITDSAGNDIDTTDYDAFTSGGTVAAIIEVSTDFEEADLPLIRVTQSADVLYIFHHDFPPQKLTRTAPTTWTLADIDFLDGPYLPLNTTATTLTLSGTSGSVTVTASGVTGINGGAGFLATDVGRLIRWRDPANEWTWLEVTHHTNTTTVTATIRGQAASAGTGTTAWRLGLYSDTTGYPAVGIFYEDRLVLAGVPTEPQRVDASRSGDFENFAPTAVDGTVTDSHAIAFTLNSNDVNAIRWLGNDEKGLLIGTATSEWVVKSSSLGEALSPTNISARQSTGYGSAAIEPARIGKVFLFVQRASRKLRELTYVFEVDGFRSPDMSLLAEHITRPGIAGMAYQGQPQSIAWMRRTDGVLLGMTYERDQDVVAWHRHELGGSSDEEGAIPIVESISVIPSPDGAIDELYLIVKRYINGATVRYIELMSKIWEVGDLQQAAVFGDCGRVHVFGSPTDTVDSLWHLEGETLGVLADGALHPDVTVQNGKIQIVHDASIITLGYRFKSDGETMPIEGGAEDGSAQGKKKRIHRVGFWLLDTLGLSYGPGPDDLTEILIGEWGDQFGVPTPLFTGVRRERFEGDYDRLGQVYFRADTMLPATVLAVMPQVNVSDDS